MYDFQKRSSLIEVSEQGAQVLGPIAAELAHGEGLQAHARAAEMRLEPAVRGSGVSRRSCATRCAALALALPPAAHAMSIRELRTLEATEQEGRSYANYYLVGVLEGLREAADAAQRRRAGAAFLRRRPAARAGDGALALPGRTGAQRRPATRPTCRCSWCCPARCATAYRCP